MPFWRKKKEDQQPEISVAQVAEVTPAEIARAPVQATPIPDDGSKQIVSFDDSTLTVRANISSVAEAKIGIKMLRAKKKELGLIKKAINQEIAAERADRKMQVARQGSMARGSGSGMKFVRDMQRMGRDSDRRKYAAIIDEKQRRKAIVDDYIIAIDTVILKVETYLLEQDAKS